MRDSSQESATQLQRYCLDTPLFPPYKLRLPTPSSGLVVPRDPRRPTRWGTLPPAALNLSLPSLRASGSHTGFLATQESCFKGSLLGQAMGLLMWSLPSFYKDLVEGKR